MAAIQKVLPLLLNDEKNKNDYIPKVVSIGPYHHATPELAAVEAFKPIAVDLFVSGGPRSRDSYYEEILKIIGELRECYEKESTAKFSDEELARMMLHDACFVINHMETSAPATLPPPPPMVHKFFTVMKHLGMLTAAIVLRDMFLLENQIPLRVIKLLINLRYEPGEDEKLLHRYLNVSIFGEYRQKRTSEIQRPEPLHLLEAFHRLVISDRDKTNYGGRYKCSRLCCFKAQLPSAASGGGGGGGAFAITTGAAPEFSGRDMAAAPPPPLTNPPHPPPLTNPPHPPPTGCINSLLSCSKPKCIDLEAGLKKPEKDLKQFVHSFRSVTDLKAKGIYFKPSPTQSLMDVDFKSHFFYARLQLPHWGVSIYTKVFFLNMVAFELSPSSPTRGEVASYINFMKSLMEKPEDVKELREKKILYNMLGSDQEVLRVYRDINTYGADNPEFFHRVKNKIQAHHSSKTKTWMAELIHTYFRSPWTIIAFLAAISLLAISAAQLHYAVHPN